MRRMEKAKIAGVLIVLSVVTGAFIVWTLRYTDGASLRLNSIADNDYETHRIYWERRIKTAGADNAYREFKEYTEKHFTSNGSKHAYAHTMGESLYNSVGLAGITVCDEAFEYGCFHSFLGKPIEEHGPSIVRELDMLCTKRWGDNFAACQHGIGHGLLVYFGYVREGLEDALEMCGTLRQTVNQISGCASGVFMEYNWHTMLNPSGSAESARPYTEGADIHAPCSWVDEQFLPACYTEQPHWWKHVYNWDYHRVGELCREAPSAVLTRYCVGSVGAATVINYDYAPDHIVAACKSMAPDLHAPCIVAAAEKFSQRYGNKETISQLCNVVEERGVREQCIHGVTSPS